MTRLLQSWATEQADRRPEATAVAMNAQSMTYGQLDAESNRLARQLKEAGCRPGDRVCLALPKCPEAVLAMHAVLKVGAAYVPLDLANPAARLAKIVATSDPSFLLASPAAGPALGSLLSELPAPIPVGWLGADRPGAEPLGVRFTLQDARAQAATPLSPAAGSEDAAHILFTSGSTGLPKGVVITHASVVHFVEWANRYFGATSADRFSGHPPLHFDLSTYDIYGSLAAGAELHMVPPELNLLPHALADFIRSRGITRWFSVPSVLSFLAKFDVVGAGDFPSLKRVLWCGETIPTPTLIYWMTRLPQVKFTNLYGPTETTIASSHHTFDRCPQDARAALPIGKACEGEELLVLDEDSRPAAVGQVGDLYIRGVGLSPGYWRDAEKTRAAFVPDPRDPSDRLYKTGDRAWVGEDGLVYFVGRVDAQIKSRGYRIELGEIEAALNTLACLQEGAVVALETGGFEGSTICCAYSPDSSRAPTPADLRAELAKLVPSYMLPSRWMAFDRLPRNASGKIDRRRLKEELERDAAPVA